MSRLYPTKELILVKRIFFLILLFIVTCSTYTEDKETTKIPELVYSSTDNGQMMADQNAPRLSSADVFKP